MTITQIQAIERAYKRLFDGFTKTRVTTKALKYILLEHGDWAMVQGYGSTLKRRSLGAGVYEIWFERNK